MAQLIWTEPALKDLQDLAEYIALDNYVAASKLVQKVFRAVERLETHPKSGRIPPELPHTPYRELVIPPCRVFYRIEKNRVYVLHIMRGERQLRKYLIDERRKQED